MSGNVQRVLAGTLIIIPAGVQHVRLQALGANDAAVVEFTPSAEIAGQ